MSTIKKAFLASIFIHSAFLASWLYYEHFMQEPQKIVTKISLASITHYEPPKLVVPEPPQLPKKEPQPVKQEVAKPKPKPKLEPKKIAKASMEPKPKPEPKECACEPMQLEATSKAPSSVDTNLSLSQPTEQKSLEPVTIPYEETYLHSYLAVIKKAIEKNKKYPRIARKMGLEGTSEVRFELLPDGTIGRIELITSSGREVLDKNSLETIQKASLEFPKPSQKITLIVPIEYRLK